MTPFISLADLAAYLRKTIESDDLLAIAAADAACQAVRDYINQDLNLVRHDTITVNGNGRKELLLPQLPVLEVHEIQVSDEIVADTDWVLGAHGILYRVETPYVWQSGVGNIDIEYTRGWAITEDDLEESDEPDATRVPSSIRMIAVRIAAGVYTHPPVNSQQVTLGSYSESFKAAAAGLVEPEMERVLDKYKIQGAS